jgi:hypothetical protein
VVSLGHLFLESGEVTPSPSKYIAVGLPSTRQLTVVHSPSWTWAGLACKETMVGGGGVVGEGGGGGVKVGGSGVCVGDTGVVEGGMGVMVGGMGVVVGGRGDEVGPTEGVVGDGVSNSPTVTMALASAPRLPWLSVALTLMV